MSEYVQIDVRLVPIYGSGGLKGAFPKLAKFLKEYGYTLVLEREPDLFHMVDVLTRIRNDPAIPVAAKQAITRVEGQMVKIRNEAREHLLARRLNELDRTLYRLEDLFKDLDRELH